MNTYQLVIASDGESSYCLMLYPEDGLQWIKGQVSELLPDEIHSALELHHCHEAVNRDCAAFSTFIICDRYIYIHREKTATHLMQEHKLESSLEREDISFYQTREKIRQSFKLFQSFSPLQVK